MIKLENNVPAYYVEQSRDFQLLCRLFNSVLFTCKNNADAVSTLTQPDKIKTTLLPLISSKVGFETKQYLEDNLLRNIVASFPYIIRKKGTLTGIALAVNTVIKSETSPISVEKVELAISKQDKEIVILTPIKLSNTAALEDLLSYVVPTGVNIVISSYTPLAADVFSNLATTLYHNDMYDIVSIQTILSSGSRGSSSEYPAGISLNTTPVEANVNTRLINRFDTSQVVGATDFEDTDE